MFSTIKIKKENVKNLNDIDNVDCSYLVYNKDRRHSLKIYSKSTMKRILEEKESYKNHIFIESSQIDEMRDITKSELYDEDSRNNISLVPVGKYFLLVYINRNGNVSKKINYLPTGSKKSMFLYDTQEPCTWFGIDYSEVGDLID